MTEQRQYVRYQVEFPATFAGDHAGIGIVHNIGLGGCKVVSDLAVQIGAPPHSASPDSGTDSCHHHSSRHSPVDPGTEFGVEFLEMQKLERARLEQFLATQVNVVA